MNNKRVRLLESKIHYALVILKLNNQLSSKNFCKTANLINSLIFLIFQEGASEQFIERDIWMDRIMPLSGCIYRLGEIKILESIVFLEKLLQ